MEKKYTKQFLKEYLKKYLPRPLTAFFMGARKFYYVQKPFNHTLAQKGELKSAIGYMDSDNEFDRLLNQVSEFGNRDGFEEIIWNTPFVKTFFRTRKEFRSFGDTIKAKRSLEVGSGPVGALVLMPWIRDRVIVDPLLDSYREAQLERFNETFFTDDIVQYSQNAEEFIPELENSINGAVITRNALDHCEDPWKVLENISRYAARGSKLLLWTDLWHVKDDLGNEHRNIVKDKNIFKKNLIDLGFGIDHEFSDVRADKSTIEYGCIATKI